MRRLRSALTTLLVVSVVVFAVSLGSFAPPWGAGYSNTSGTAFEDAYMGLTVSLYALFAGCLILGVTFASVEIQGTNDR